MAKRERPLVHIFHVALVLLLCFGGVGCAPKRAIYVRDTKKIEVAPMGGSTVLVRLALYVENHNPRSLGIRDGDFLSWRKGNELARIRLQEVVTVGANSADTVWVPLEVRFASVGKMLSFALMGEMDDWRDIEVEGYVKARYGCTRKKIKITRRKIGDVIVW